MRNRVFQLRMNLLALVAVMLLALLPTLGRLAQAGHGVAADVWTQMCTMTGMKLVKLPLTAGQQGAPTPVPDHAGMDCDYCPLLSVLGAAVVALVLALLGFAQSPAPFRCAQPPGTSFYPTGLGSRGPPRFSEIAL